MDAVEAHSGALVIDARDPTMLLARQVGAHKPRYWSALQQGGLTAVIADVPWVYDGLVEATSNFAAWHERIDANRDDALVVRAVDDILRAKDTARVGVILSSQSPTPVEHDVANLRILYELGLRVLAMAYNRRNLLADGCRERDDGGVSQLGREAIAEMNRLGIAIDLSHASDLTMRQTLELSTAPVFFSHANARALVPHPRNVPDDVLRQVADQGGLCCVTAYSDFLRTDGSRHGTSVVDMAEMLRYLTSVMGVEHVGIGLDIGEDRSAAELSFLQGGRDVTTRYALRSRSELPSLTSAMVDVGFTGDQIEGILGRNLLRFLQDVWR